MEQKSIISEQSRANLDKDTVNFYLNEADKQLEGIVNVSNGITERSYILLSGIIAILTGFGWILKAQEGDWTLYVVSVLGMVASIAIITILILKVICVHTIWLPGKRPSELDIDVFIDYYSTRKLTKEQRYIHIVADHLDAIEAKIALNLRDVKIRTIWYARCLKICLYTICAIACILIVGNFI
jgi:hypothetical protein